MLSGILLVFSLLFGSMQAQTTGAGTPVSSQPLIILMGPPLSGKTTFAETIARTYGVPGISIEDIIRDNAAELDKLRGEGVSLAEMRYDPAISRYLRERLKTTDLSHGLTLDGYPATLVQAEDLAKMLPDLNLRLLALRLQVPDDTIRKRAKTTGRESDNPQIIEQQIKDYHRELGAISLYFPNAKIIDIDASHPEPQVWEEIQTALTGAGVRPTAAP